MEVPQLINPGKSDPLVALSYNSLCVSSINSFHKKVFFAAADGGGGEGGGRLLSTCAKHAVCVSSTSILDGASWNFIDGRLIFMHHTKTRVNCRISQIPYFRPAIKVPLPRS